MYRALLLFLCLASLPAIGNAATYYVATTGNDTNPGSLAQPFLTIAQGVLTAVAGDTLIIRAGTYPGINSQTQTIHSGTSWANPITVQAFTGETVTMQYLNINGYGSTVYQYLIFDGFHFDAQFTSTVGIFIGGANAHHIRVQNSEVIHGQRQGVQGYDTGYLEFLHLSVHDNGTDRLKHGFYLAIQNSLIEDCDVYANTGYGIQIYNSSCATGHCADNTIIRRNRIHNNLGDGAVTLNHGWNIRFYSNLVYGHSNGVEVSYGNPTGTLIYNNTIWSNSGSGVNPSGGTSTQIINNILYQNGTPIHAGGTGTTAANNLTTNPLFTDSSTGDFHLQAGSPAIGAGQNLTGTVLTDFAGDTWSLPMAVGAYNFGAAPAILPAPTNLRLN